MIDKNMLLKLLIALADSNIISDANGEETIDLIKALLWTCESEVDE